jgi:hypothetical protein
MTFDDAVKRILEYWDRQYSDRGGISQPPNNATGLNAPLASDERVFVGGRLFSRQKKRKKQHRK